MKKKAAVFTAAVAAVFLFAVLWQCGYTVILKKAYPLKYDSLIRRYSAENHVDPALAFAVVKNESNFNPKAVSNQGALGLMQLTPETFAWGQSKLKEKAAYRTDDLYDPEINIKFGTLILSRFLQEFHYDNMTAVAAYHAGRGNVNKWLANKKYSGDGKKLNQIPFDTTRNYVQKVLKSREIYEKLYFES